mgnify:CR=1 FL=1|tara:strand:- start:141 stop:770 length:630 start_codon:yes stop_codon:yes gene_type:complete
MHPKQNPKKTRGKGGKKERKRRDEMKKYALIVTQESQLGNEINHNKQRLNDICEKFSNCCKKNDAAMANGLVHYMLKITALTNSHICALNKDKVGYLEFLEEFDCHVKTEQQIVPSRGFVTMDDKGNLKLQDEDNFVNSYEKDAKLVKFHIEKMPRLYEKCGWWNLPKKTIPINLIFFEWSSIQKKCRELEASEKLFLSELLEKTEIIL